MLVLLYPHLPVAQAYTDLTNAEAVLIRFSQRQFTSGVSPSRTAVICTSYSLVRVGADTRTGVSRSIIINYYKLDKEQNAYGATQEDYLSRAMPGLAF